MVKFFNQKEEVVQVELTPYGKEVFTSGSFYPHYYAFYDTDILYDGQFGGVTEIQNNIVDRVKDSTPRLNRNTRYTSTEQPQVALSALDWKNNFYQSSSYNAPYYRFLGENSPFSDYSPAWSINLDSSTTVNFNDGVKYNFNHTVPERSASLAIEYGFDDLENGIRLYSLENNNRIVLDVQELNTLFKLNGNFEVEVLKVHRNGSNERLESLGFINESSPNAESLYEQTGPTSLSQLIVGTDAQIQQSFPILDNSFVEYYLNISLDREIPQFNAPLGSIVYRNPTSEDQEFCRAIGSRGRDNS